MIGAGIAGLCAARGLQSLGWEIEIYEQAEELRPLGAGIMLSANALRALRALDLYDAVVGEAQPIDRISLLDQKGKLLQKTDHQRLSEKYGHLTAVAMHRGALHRALLSCIDSSVLRTSMLCVDARQDADHVTLSFAGGETIEAELVIACDGIDSTVRARIFPNARKRFADYTCWRAVAPHLPAGFDRHEVTVSWGAAGKGVGLVPLQDGRLYWFACCGAAVPDDPGLAKADLLGLQRMFADFHFPVEAMIRETPPDALIRTDIFDVEPMPRFTEPRVILLGDAAHAVTPDLGQGAGLAIEDAAVMAALVAEHPMEHAMRQYESLRVPRAHKMARESRRYARIALIGNPLAVKVRNAVMRNIPEWLVDRQLDALLDVQFEPVRRAA